MEEAFTFVVAILLIILFIADWSASYILHRLARQSPVNNIAIKERASMATILALSSSINVILATTRLFELKIGGFSALVLLSISLILGSVPNLYWLSLYYRNRLRK